MVDDLATVVRYDQRGCGRSERRGPYSVDRNVADLDSVRRHFEWEQVRLLGHSWGASLALYYALRHPTRVERLVYISGTGLGQQWKLPYRQAQAERLARYRARLAALEAKPRSDVEDREWAILQWSADFADAETALVHAEQLATPWFPINYESNRAIGADGWPESYLIAACRALTVATLVIAGSEDIRPYRATDSLVEALPRARRLVLDGAGHLPWVERPDTFAAEVRRFLTTLR